MPGFADYLQQNRPVPTADTGFNLQDVLKANAMGPIQVPSAQVSSNDTTLPNPTPSYMNSPAYQKAEHTIENTSTGLTHNLPNTKQPGFFKKLGKVAEGIGNVVGDVFAPGTMSLIPGTQLNRIGQVRNAQEQINTLNTAGIAGIKSQADEERAKAAEQRAHTADTIAGKGEWKQEPTLIGPNGEPVMYNSLTGESKYGNISGIKPTSSITDKGDKEPLTNYSQYQKDIDARVKALGLDSANYSLGSNPTVGDLTRVTKQLSEDAAAAHQKFTEDQDRQRLINEKNNTGDTIYVPDTENPGQFIAKKATPDMVVPAGAVTKTELTPTSQTRLASERSGTMADLGTRITQELQDPTIQAEIGPINGRINELKIRAGIGDSRLTTLYNDLKSYGAFQAGLHPVRGVDAMEYFDTILGGLGQTPEELLAKIASNTATGKSVQNVSGKTQGTKENKIPAGADGTFTVGGKTYYHGAQGNNLGEKK